MSPCYRHNDYVVLSKYWPRSLKAGDDIVCHHNKYGVILKRILATVENNIQITGLNAASTSQKDLGSIEKEDIIGKVVWHIKQKQL